MIGIPSAAAELEAPAKTERELFDRLALHIGRILSVDLHAMGGSKTIVARLEGVEFEWGPELAVLTFSALSDRDSNSRYARLSSTYRVLCDGIWNVIHEPQKKGN